MKKIPERIFMNAEVPKPLEKSARIAAARLGVSRSELVRLAVADFLKRMESQPVKPESQAVEFSRIGG